MHLARVIGTVVATVKNEPLDGRKLLVIQPVDARGGDDGRPLVAVDSSGAGVGETVIWCRGKESSFPFLHCSTFRCPYRDSRFPHLRRRRHMRARATTTQPLE